MASFSLAFLLDIEYENIADTKSLGNSSSALSFNQKLNLLLDNKSISKEEKLKLESFMNIRNQFVHNKDANSYSKAISYISGLENRLKKIYPRFFIDLKFEDAIEKCVAQLYTDSLSIFGDFKGGREDKLKTTSERDFYKKKYVALNNSLKNGIDRVKSSLLQNKSGKMKNIDIASMIDSLSYEIMFEANKNYVNDTE